MVFTFHVQIILKHFFDKNIIRIAYRLFSIELEDRTVGSVQRKYANLRRSADYTAEKNNFAENFVQMPVSISLQLSPKQAADPKIYVPVAARRAGVSDKQVALARVVKRSVDARKSPKINLTLELYIDNEARPAPVHFDYPDVSGRTPVVIVGSGPAGLFCALRLIESGLRPIVLERGKDVAERGKDIALINRNQGVNPDSNYAFGEGGAGTFSDGKLFTRSKKRGDYNRALQTLVFHGASPEILYEAHPHIGTDRLPRIMTAIRETIRRCGGEVVFGARVTDIEICGGRATGVWYADSAGIPANNSGLLRRSSPRNDDSGLRSLSRGMPRDPSPRNDDSATTSLREPSARNNPANFTSQATLVEGAAVVLAAGHSARDIYEILHRRGVALEAKPFAMGVRIEHPQQLIDSIQYHTPDGRGEYLPAAAYQLVSQEGSRGLVVLYVSGRVYRSGDDLRRRGGRQRNVALAAQLALRQFGHRDGGAACRFRVSARRVRRVGGAGVSEAAGAHGEITRWIL